MAQTPNQSIQIGYGSKGGNVSQLQGYLKSLGLYGGKIDSIWGPKTQAALEGFQNFFGVPKTGRYDAPTQGAMSHVTSDPAYQLLGDPLISGLMSHDPRFANTVMSSLKSGGASKNLLISAHKANNDVVNTTGYGHNGELHITGNPATDENFWKLALKQEDPSFQEGLGLYKADFNAGLQKQQQDYQAYLENKQRQLVADKATADTNEAQNGTLFSTGRGQRRTAIADAYNADIAQKGRDTSYAIGNLGRGLEENYGSDVAGAANYDLPGGNVNGGTLGYASTGLRRAYTPVGGIYGKQNTNKMNNARIRYNYLKNGSQGLLY